MDRLIASPQPYANRVIVPQGLQTVGTELIHRADNYLTVPMIDLRNIYQTQDLSFTSLNVVLDPEVAARIQNLVALGQLQRRNPVNSLNRDPLQAGYPAILTLRIEKKQTRGQDYWVGTIIKLELLTKMDLERIGARRFSKAFSTLVVTPSEVREGYGDEQEWPDRVGPTFIRNIVAHFRNAKRMSDAQKRAFLSQQMGLLMNQAASMGAKAAADERARIERIMPGATGR
jgi:hypothetical protein